MWRRKLVIVWFLTVHSPTEVAIELCMPPHMKIWFAIRNCQLLDPLTSASSLDWIESIANWNDVPPGMAGDVFTHRLMASPSIDSITQSSIQHVEFHLLIYHPIVCLSHRRTHRNCKSHRIHGEIGRLYYGYEYDVNFRRVGNIKMEIRAWTLSARRRSRMGITYIGEVSIRFEWVFVRARVGGCVCVRVCALGVWRYFSFSLIRLRLNELHEFQVRSIARIHLSLFLFLFFRSQICSIGNFAFLFRLYQRWRHERILLSYSCRGWRCCRCAVECLTITFN